VLEAALPPRFTLPHAVNDTALAVRRQPTVERAARLGLDARRFLDNNDSYHFFQPLGDLLVTGPTGTNVMDVRLLLVGEP
jgi:glycerate-2-kinase